MTSILSYRVVGQNYLAQFEVLTGGDGRDYIVSMVGKDGRFSPDANAGMRLTLYNPEKPKQRLKANALMKTAMGMDFKIPGIDSLTIEHKENSNQHRDLVSKGRVQANYRYSAIGLYTDVLNKIIGCGKKALKKDSRGLVNPLPGISLPHNLVRVVFTLNWLDKDQKNVGRNLHFLDTYRKNDFKSARGKERFTLKEVWEEFSMKRKENAYKRIEEFIGSGEIRVENSSHFFHQLTKREIMDLISQCLRMPSDEAIAEQKAYMIAAKDWEENKKYGVSEETKEVCREMIDNASTKTVERECLVCGLRKKLKLSKFKEHIKSHLGYGGVAHRKRKFEDCFD